MITENEAEVWWSWITGPQRFIYYILSGLRENRNVLIVDSQKLSWIHTMRNLVEDQMRSDGFYLEQIDSSIHATWEQVGKDLIEYLSDDEVAMNYRGSSVINAVSYIRDNRILHRKVIWIQDLDEKDLPKWLEFCRHWKVNSREQGLLILECRQAEVTQQIAGNISLCQPKEHIKENDVRIFCELLTSRLSGHSLWKQYIATVAAELFSLDAENSARMIHDADFLSDDLFAIYGALPLMGPRLSREAFHRRIWKAQIRIAFPLIEELQYEYIEAHYAEIAQALQNAGDEAYRFGQIITKPFDAELGLLLHMANCRIDRQTKLLYLPNGAYEKLYILKERRNELAHMTCCKQTDLYQLFVEDFTSIMQSDLVGEYEQRRLVSEVETKVDRRKYALVGRN